MSITFEEVMAFHPGNPDVYKEIRDNIDQLLPFVGAGLTAPVYGTWTTTLTALGAKLANPKSRDKLSVMIGEGNYLQAAQFLQDKRRPLNLAHDLVHHFSREKLEDDWGKIQEGAIWLLPDLFECPVLTTNFDEAIETVYPRRGVVPFNSLDPTNGYLVKHATRLKDTPCVFKLHGTVAGNMMDLSTLVLTEQQYNKHYAIDGQVRKALRAFVDSRGMLFLGCSLGADKTVEVLKEAAGEGAVHYAIVECMADEPDDRVGVLADIGIRAIVYEDGKHESVRIVLEQLLEDIGLKGTNVEPPSVQRIPAHVGADRGRLQPAGDGLAKLVERINARLVRQRKGHPSFQLMTDDPVETLLPKGERRNTNALIPNAKRLVRAGEGEEVPFRNFIRDSWGSGKQTHLYITGRGGVGKTVALLTLATEPGFLPKETPAIYIPLYDLAQYADDKRECVDRYLERSFSEEERTAIERLSFEAWHDGPGVILLLDGHNEIPGGRRNDVEAGIRAWAERPGTQLVTTSRAPGLFGVTNTQLLQLQGLSRKAVEEYLGDCGIAMPEEADARLWQMLETPLMLRLYADVSSLPRYLQEPYLTWEQSDSAGHLVWNYLQLELWRFVSRNRGDLGEAEYAFANLLAIPYVCWRMESAHEFKVSREKMAEYVGDACMRWNSVDLPDSFRGVEDSLGAFVMNISDRAFVSSLRTILAEESGLLAWVGDGFALMHQSLRDGLAAIHLKNVMKAPDFILPEEFRRPISEYVMDFLGDLVEDKPLLNLWEINRKTLPTDAVSTHNLLRLIHRKYGGDLSMLDWSGMDLRGESLFPYRRLVQPLEAAHDSPGLSHIARTRLRVSLEPERFSCTALDIGCFRPQDLGLSVVSACFSPDGSILAACCLEGALRLWDPATGRLLREIDTKGRTDSVCFSPDGSLLAGCCLGGLKLWDPATGRLVREIDTRGRTDSVCFSPDGSLLAACYASAVRFWDPVTGRMVREIDIGGRTVSACFSPDGSLLATCCFAGLRLWDPATGRLVRELAAGVGVDYACFSPDGSLLAGCCLGGLKLWDPATGRLVREIAAVGPAISQCFSPCFSPDGSLLVACYARAVRFWDPSSGKLVRETEAGDAGWITSACFSPDGSLLAVFDFNRALWLWDPATGRLVREVAAGDRADSVCFSPDGSFLAVRSEAGSLRLWDPATGRLVRHIAADDHVASACFSPDGSLLVVRVRDGAPELWDPVTDRLIREFGVADYDRTTAACFSPDGSLLAACSLEGALRLYDPATGQLVREFAVGGYNWATSACFSPDGSLLAACSEAGTLRLWDPVTGRLVRRIAISDQVVSVCFSPDGSLLAVRSEGMVVGLWDPATGQLVRRIISGDDESVTSVCFSPDGLLLAVCYSGGAVRLWDPTTGRLVRGFAADMYDWATSVCFSPDGTVLAVCFGEHVRLWDVRDHGFRNQPLGFISTIEPLFGIDISGLDLSLAIIEDEHDREVIRQNGVKV